MWIAILLFIALVCPNTLQILAPYEPALGVKPQSTAPVIGKLRIPAWGPSLPWAVAVSVVAAIAIFSTRRPKRVFVLAVLALSTDPRLIILYVKLGSTSPSIWRVLTRPSGQICPPRNSSEVMGGEMTRKSNKERRSGTDQKYLIIMNYSRRVSARGFGRDTFLRHDRTPLISRCHGRNFTITIPKFDESHGRQVAGTRNWGAQALPARPFDVFPRRSPATKTEFELLSVTRRG